MNLKCNLQSLYSIKAISLIVISVQSTAMILLLRYSRTLHLEDSSLSQPRPQYVISTAIFMTEILKLLFSLFYLHMENGYLLHNTRDILHREVFGKLFETCKLLVPAGLYFIQNSLVYIALTNLDAATYQVNTVESRTDTSSQLGIGAPQQALPAFEGLSDLERHIHLTDPPVATKQFAVDSILKDAAGVPIRKLYYKEGSMKQKEGLSTIILSSSNHASTTSLLFSLLAVLVCCGISGFAGVYFEYLVKMSCQTSLVVRNIQLGLFSLAFASLGVCCNAEQLWNGGFFQGYSWATCIVVLLQATGGLVASLTMKYADNILKVFATSVSIVLSTLLSSTMMVQTTAGPYFVSGTIAVLCSTLLYGLVPAPVALKEPSHSAGSDERSCAEKSTRVLLV